MRNHTRLFAISMCVTGIFLVAIAASLWKSERSNAPDTAPNKQIKAVHDASVLVRTSCGQGSGTIFNRDGRSFIWTAGHVVEGTDFNNVKVIRGKMAYKARVIRYSSIRGGRDLALLEVTDGFLECEPIRFYNNSLAPGSFVVHVGSIHGAENPRSVSFGMVSASIRKFRIGHNNRRFFYQYDITAAPGCSGGGLFVGDQYVGMLTLGRRGIARVHYGVPSFDMVRWAVSSGVPWAVDYTSPVPRVITPLFEEDHGNCGVLPHGLKTLIGG